FQDVFDKDAADFLIRDIDVVWPFYFNGNVGEHLKPAGNGQTDGCREHELLFRVEEGRYEQHAERKILPRLALPDRAFLSPAIVLVNCQYYSAFREWRGF